MTVRQIHDQDTPDEPIPPAKPATADRYKGALLGCALGDAVGAWAEARPSDEARDFAKYFVREFDFSKVEAHHHGMRFGQYTDDTQLSRELALSIIDEGCFAPEDFADRIARAFSRNEIVGYGGATAAAAIKLIDGVSWEDSGTPPPRAGNGAAMRAGPIGMFYYNDTPALIQAAVNQAIITHKAPMSVAAAVAIALATAMALMSSDETTGPHEPGWWSWLAQHVETNNKEFADDIRALSKLVWEGRKTAQWKIADDAEIAAAKAFVLEGDDTRWDGVSPYARTSTLWSLYCVMASPNDVWKAIEIAIMVGGDSDTIAAMAATVVGANVGLDAFPQKALETVAPLIHDVKADRYTWDGLAGVAELLHEVVQRDYEQRLAAWETEQAKVISIESAK